MRTIPYHSLTIKIQDFSKWAVNPEGLAAGTQKKHNHDHIETYLGEPVLTADSIAAAGGYLNYWQTSLKTRPCVTRMALDYVSAPGILKIYIININ